MNINTNKYKWFITNKEDNVTATPIAVCGLLSEKTDELEDNVTATPITVCGLFCVVILGLCMYCTWKIRTFIHKL